MATTSKELEVESRTASGKNANRRLRAAGRVPGNVYGMDRPPFAVAVPARRIREVLSLESGQNTILTLSLVGSQNKRDVMIRELQRDPVRGHVIHVDFVRVDANKTLQVNVPIRLIGTAEGVKNEGGVMDFVHREVAVSCLPGAIPEHLDVDVSALHLNQHVSVADLAAIEGVEYLDEPDTIIAVVSMSKAEVAPTDEEAAEVAEGEEAPAAEGEEGKEGKAGKESDGDK